MRIILYHIPQNSGTPVTPDLAAGLNAAFPETVVAYKDSSGDWSNTAAVIAAAPALSVFPGSEVFLTKGLAAGAAGSISATVNLNAAAIRGVFDGLRAGAPDPDADAAMRGFRMAVQEAGLIPAMKAVLALKTGDRRWLRLRAPLCDATIERGEELLAALGSQAAHLEQAA